MRWGALAACILGVYSHTEFIVFSAPEDAAIYQVKAPSPGASYDPAEVGAAVSLVAKSDAIGKPMGVAIGKDATSGASYMYVADEENLAIWRYTIQVGSSSGVSTVGPPVKVVQNVGKPRWVAVDPNNNLYFTDADTNRVLKMTSSAISKGDAAGVETIYDGSIVTQVSAPGGIAVDSFFVAWGNQAADAAKGAIVRGLRKPKKQDTADRVLSVLTIASNANKVEGLCFAGNSVYFADSQGDLFAVNKQGGAITPVFPQSEHGLESPRGCSQSEDGTLFWADFGGDKIFSMPASTAHPQPLQQISLVASLGADQKPFGLLVVSSARQCTVLLVWAMMLRFSFGA
mmetsp:Transcript_21905/g.48054  ORF Transcript_21905/g.48054 Transcript_21905/m.48054 type:complete len:344 (+) Transcript_21905:87-1118(+)|eukprot:CAMPEP_0204387544 /NCGR_PEP_ID=MMETSP0469-20131031/59011_1 /ASSEMBLY_ACC=CAM_ASM_000384 /TAXON_ID=2969 /ORGANISM="Oxyrrhis marina" /LENGTH=343 /DNA_ID=CAMNT_0051380933 /DNA_START=93 /DNA_END=1124 /DNA_ORIENTATION=+